MLVKLGDHGELLVGGTVDAVGFEFADAPQHLVVAGISERMSRAKVVRDETRRDACIGSDLSHRGTQATAGEALDRRVAQTIARGRVLSLRRLHSRDCTLV